MRFSEFRPDYKRYGRGAAPLKRNLQIIEYADIVLAFWDGTSKGTKFVIDNCKKMGVEVRVYINKDGEQLFDLYNNNNEVLV